MTNDEKLMQQALDALEHCAPHQDLKNPFLVIEALRDRLAQPEPDMDWKDMYEKEKRLREMWTAKYEKDIRVLPKAYPTAQPEPEPVAWMFPDDLERFQASETFAQAFSIACGSPTQGKTLPLYASPPQHVWQGLTDEEMSEAYNTNYNNYGEHVEYGDFVLVYRAIEAKLREKNA